MLFAELLMHVLFLTVLLFVFHMSIPTPPSLQVLFSIALNAEPQDIKNPTAELPEQLFHYLHGSTRTSPRKIRLSDWAGLSVNRSPVSGSYRPA